MNFGNFFFKKINLKRNNWDPIIKMIRIRTTNQKLTRVLISPPPAASRAFICACAARAVSGQPRSATCPCRSRLNVLNPFILLSSNSTLNLPLEAFCCWIPLSTHTFNNHCRWSYNSIMCETSIWSMLFVFGFWSIKNKEIIPKLSLIISRLNGYPPVRPTVRSSF